jgi:hypothetical protein
VIYFKKKWTDEKMKENNGKIVFKVFMDKEVTRQEVHKKCDMCRKNVKPKN